MSVSVCFPELIVYCVADLQQMLLAICRFYFYLFILFLFCFVLFGNYKTELHISLPGNLLHFDNKLFVSLSQTRIHTYTHPAAQNKDYNYFGERKISKNIYQYISTYISMFSPHLY